MAAAAAPQNEGVPYIGSRISLISKKDIRYEGILYNINTKDSTVALQTVRSFGTEDRVAGPGHVPPSTSIFEYVIFNGADIKDLHVCEAPNVTLPDDPAIVNSQAPPPAPAVAAPAAATPAAAAPPQQSKVNCHRLVKISHIYVFSHRLVLNSNRSRLAVEKRPPIEQFLAWEGTCFGAKRGV